jgi:cell division protein FtsB
LNQSSKRYSELKSELTNLKNEISQLRNEKQQLLRQTISKEEFSLLQIQTRSKIEEQHQQQLQLLQTELMDLFQDIHHLKDSCSNFEKMIEKLLIEREIHSCSIEFDVNELNPSQLSINSIPEDFGIS